MQHTNQGKASDSQFEAGKDGGGFLPFDQAEMHDHEGPTSSNGHMFQEGIKLDQRLHASGVVICAWADAIC